MRSSDVKVAVAARVPTLCRAQLAVDAPSPKLVEVTGGWPTSSTPPLDGERTEREKEGACLAGSGLGRNSARRTEEKHRSSGGG